MKRSILVLAVLAAAAGGGPGGAAPDPAEKRPDARALYDLMVETMRGAETLSWKATYTNGTLEMPEASRSEYSIWLKKPNFARMEGRRNGDLKGVLVGDGDHMWVHWPTGRPRYNLEHAGERGLEYERTKNIAYMKQRTPVGRHSIAHLSGKLGAGIVMTILNPSTFHGFTDSLQPYLDGATWVDEEKVGDVLCDVVDIRIMRGQRTWRLWLAREDHLPRKVEQTIRARSTYVSREVWTDIRIDEDVPDERFAWKPPEGWVEWRLPHVNEGLLKTGVEAPDFDLPLDGGGRAKLSAYRGKIVWLYVWRAG